MSEPDTSQNNDPAFSERINELIGVLNQQAENADVADVADTAIYAAARYLVFAHSSGFESQKDFDDSRAQAIDHFLTAFREIIEDNYDEYSETFYEKE